MYYLNPISLFVYKHLFYEVCVNWHEDKMSTITITKLYSLLSGKLGKDVEDKTKILATKADLAETKSEVIKWMFIFWIGQVVATFGFILLFLNK